MDNIKNIVKENYIDPTSVPFFSVKIDKEMIIEAQKNAISRLKAIMVDAETTLDKALILVGKERADMIREANERIRFAQVAITSLKCLHDQERKAWGIEEDKSEEDIIRIRIE